MQWLASVFAKPLLDKIFSVVGSLVSKWILQIGLEIERRKKHGKAKKAAKNLKEAKGVKDKRDAFNKLP